MYTEDEISDILKYNYDYFLEIEHTEEICLFVVNINGIYLKDLKKQNQKICSVAIKNNPYSFIYVKNKTYELCKLAVSLQGDLLSMVPFDIPNRYELEKIAIKEDGYAIQYVTLQTQELKLAAVTQNGWALEFIDKQSPDICRAAVEEYGMALSLVKDKTTALCLKAVKNYGMALQYVDKQTKQIINTALKNDGCAIQFVKHIVPEMYILAVKNCGLSLEFIKRDKQTPEICELAIQQNPDAINFVLLNYKPSYLPCSAPDDHCAICLEDDKEGWCKMQACTHKFHLECIKQNEPVSKKCPMCRTPFKMVFERD
jgi:hypothetical protein